MDNKVNESLSFEKKIT